MRHTTFRQLEIFEAIARLGSFTKASEELHLTQPTVSMQIKKLTDTVGAPLLEQVGKKVQLTDVGRDLVKAAREVFSTLDGFAMSVAERQGMKKGRLKLMAITTASYFAPRLLGEFSRLYPGIEVVLRVNNREKLLASVADNPDDLYILGRPPDDIDVVATPFLENPIVVLAPPDHPLAGEKNISLKRLAQEPWLMREAGSGTRIAIEKLFSSKGMELKPRLELGSNEAIKQAILSGLGISALSAHTLALDQVGQFVVLDAEGFPIMSHWYVVYPTARPPSLVARTFLDFLLRQEERIASVTRAGKP